MAKMDSDFIELIVSCVLSFCVVIVFVFWTQGYGGIGDDLSYFDLLRNLFEIQCNGPTI